LEELSAALSKFRADNVRLGIEGLSSNICPVTLLEAIQRSTEFLERKGVDSSRLQAELLLAHLLKLPRMQLYLNFARALSAQELEQFRSLIQRRGKREPLQYIIGTTSFCGLEIAVNPHVLIPRPETELLAERGWKYLAQLSSAKFKPCKALDFGTGSGCIAIALAVNCADASVTGVDLSAEALALARQNAEHHGVAERIEFVHSEKLERFSQGAIFDLVVSNPPYVPTAEIQTLQPEVREHEPHAALDGGPDGLDYFRKLAVQAAQLMKPEGRLMLEFGDGHAPAVTDILQQENWIVEELQEDYTQRPRIVVARR